MEQMDVKGNGAPSGTTHTSHARRTVRTRNGLTSEQRRQQRREALIDAGLDLFGTKGYNSTSVEEICRTAYVSTRNFYEEFENREAVLFALGDRLVGEAYQAMVEASIEEGPDRLDREARARVAALAHALLDDPRRARIAFIETLGVSPLQEARRRNAHRLFAQYFAALVRADFSSEGFGTREEDIFAVALVGAINEILSDWVLRADKPPLDDLIDPIVDIIALMSDRLRGASFDRSATGRG